MHYGFSSAKAQLNILYVLLIATSCASHITVLNDYCGRFK